MAELAARARRRLAHRALRQRRAFACRGSITRPSRIASSASPSVTPAASARWRIKSSIAFSSGLAATAREVAASASQSARSRAVCRECGGRPRRAVPLSPSPLRRVTYFRTSRAVASQRSSGAYSPPCGCHRMNVATACFSSPADFNPCTLEISPARLYSTSTEYSGKSRCRCRERRAAMHRSWRLCSRR